MSNKKTVILVGAGLRGVVYTNYILKRQEDYQVVAVAEPLADRRTFLQKTHNIPEDMLFEDWKDLLAKPKMADACIICTMDRDHTEPTLAAIEKGYEILLEKPAAENPEDCMKMVLASEEKNVNVLVCHVLRYTPFFTTLKNLIDDGAIGKVMQIRHTEDVGHLHQSHSFVRGNWGNSDESTPMILQKCCHDLDILQWLVGTRCTRIQSFGKLSHFTKENCPEGAPLRCIDGCPAGDTCYYNAAKIYNDPNSPEWFKTAATKKHDPTPADIDRALRTTNYGKCVYQSNNNVVDHQVVNMEFEGDVYASLSMAAFNQGGRDIYIMGTGGTLYAKMKDDHITHFDFKTGETKEIPVVNAITGEHFHGGHGGGDIGIMQAFFERMKGEYTGKSICSLRQSCENHLMAFAAERSRLEGTVVDMNEYVAEVEKSIKG